MNMESIGDNSDISTNIKQLGQVFTPKNIVDFMIKQSNPTIHQFIIEPSCGDGAFIIGLLDFFVQKYSIQDIQVWFETKLVALDIDKFVLEKCKENIQNWFKKHNVFNIQLNSIYHGDALTYQPNPSLLDLLTNQKFDLCIGNPPYVQAQHMDKTQLDYIKSNFKSCKKYKPNLYYAFIERFFALSNRLMFIVPNSFQSNLSGKYIKELIHQHSISETIDFKHNKQFSNADTYTCIIDLSNDGNHDFNNSFTIKNNMNTDDIGISVGCAVANSFAIPSSDSYNDINKSLDKQNGNDVLLDNHPLIHMAKNKLDPDLVNEAAGFFGSQAIVVAVDAKAVNPENTRWEIFTHGGRTPTGLDAVEWAVEMQRRGAGEILLTSMDRDGTKRGFNLPLTRAVSEAVDIPVIASGGVGNVQHLIDGIKEGKADAVLAASIFHFGEVSIRDAKLAMREAGIEVRL